MDIDRAGAAEVSIPLLALEVFLDNKHFSTALLCAFIGILPACSSDGEDPPPDNRDLGTPNPDGKPGNAQTPPTTTASAMEAWLKRGDYKGWACETAEHAQLKVSPHGFNRVCSNELAASFAGGVNDERPVNTASVKELYDDSASLVGYAVGVKVKAESAGGDGWYWYERVPLDSAAPHDSRGVVADGLGSSGAAQSICVSCHAGAGSDAMHDVMGSSDFVYLQVNAAAGGAPNPEGDEQTPPTTSAKDIESWLENGDYKSWACETVEHAQLKVSPHGFNRVCSNELASTFEGTVDDERPVGTASVKELFDDAATLVGYALSIKMGADSDSGKNWFWYERLAQDTVANGLGVPGCVGCHGGAGSDAEHEVTGSSDYVYLQVDP